MAFHDLPANREPHPRAFVLLATVESLEHLENPVEIFDVEPNALVSDGEFTGAVGRAGTAGAYEPALHRHVGRFTRSMELEPVRDEVLEQLPYLHRIRLDRRQLADVDKTARLLQAAFKIGADLLDRRGEIHGNHRLRLGGDARKGQQGFDQIPHPRGGRLHAFEVVPTLLPETVGAGGLQAVAERLNLPQRLLQVVRCDRRELFQFFITAAKGVVGRSEFRRAFLDPTFQLIVGLLERALRLFPQGEIRQRRHGAASFGHLDRRQADLHRDFAAVLAPGKQIPPDAHRAWLRMGGESVAIARMVRAEALRNEQLDRLPDELLVRVAEQRGRLPVRQPDAAVGTDHQDGVR